MLNSDSGDSVAAFLERHAIDHPDAEYKIVFPEGDSYLCRWSNGEYVDNGAPQGSSLYEEWYELDYAVLRTIVAGSNKDPRFEFLCVSGKNLPSAVFCGNDLIYGNG